MAAELGLEVGAWQDGIVHKSEPPFPRNKFPNKDVAVYAWRNVWETGLASDVYKLANAGYQVGKDQLLLHLNIFFSFGGGRKRQFLKGRLFCVALVFLFV